MSKLHIKKDDTVIVLAGEDKGAKPAAKNPQGGIVKMEAPIHISNLSLIDPKSGKATRVAVKKTDDGKKVRIAKKSGEEIK